MPNIAVQRLGLLPYKTAWDYQEKLFNHIVDTKLLHGVYSGHSYLLLTEHLPVYTIGKSGKAAHLLDANAEVVKINRGGDITFHGLGQLVVYPILDLDQYFTDLKKYMRHLEEVVIKVLAEYNIKGQRLDGATGVWIDVENPLKVRKICAMGVRSSRWVTMHGLALNINTDLNYFDKIVPCGIADKGVTSMKKELGFEISLEEVQEKLIQQFAVVFGAEVVDEQIDRL